MSIAQTSPKLSSELLETYQRNGVIKIVVPESVSLLRCQFLEEMCLWLKEMAGTIIDPGNLATGLVELARENRNLIARLYKISRRFPSAKQLASHPFFVDMAQQLMRSALVSCCHFVNVRIDLPEENQFLLEAHQDFPYIQGSYNGLTIWMPFMSTDFLLGPPSWIPGSNRWGMLQVIEYSLDQIGGSGGKSFRIADTDRIKAEHFVNQDVQEDEALVLSTLLVHRSEPNVSSRARLSIQLRFDDATALESFDRNYPEGLYLGDTFAKNFPEHLAR